MKTRMYIFLVLIFSCFASCNNTEDSPSKNESKYTDTSFKKVEKLTSKKLDSISNHLIYPGQILAHNNHLFIIDRKSKGPIHAIDIQKEQYIGAFGKKGQGPGEISAAWSLSKIDDSSFLLSDVGLKKVMGYKIESLFDKHLPYFEQKINQSSIATYTKLHNNEIFFVDDYNSKNRLFKSKLGDDKSKIIGYGDIPKLTKIDELDNVKAEAASAYMKYNNGYFVFAYKLTPRIDIFDYQNNQWKTIISPKEFKPLYKSIKEGDNNFFAITDETLNAYLDIALTDKYIYALFSEEEVLKDVYSHGNTIYVFDYQGNPIKKYLLDKEVSFFDVKQDSTLYGLRVDVLPELLKFNLKT